MNLPSASWVDAGTMPPAGRSEAWRRLAVTVGVVVLYMLGTRIPLPLDPPVPPSQDWGYLNKYMPPSQVHRFSILAIGFGPILTILFLRELGRSFIPPFRRWADRDANAARLNVGTGVLILILAGIGAVKMTLALEKAQYFPSDSDWLLSFDVFITLVAGTMLLWWFCGLIDRYGLGHGFWLLFMTPALERMLISSLDILSGQYGWKAVMCFIGLHVVGIALIIAAWTAKYRPITRTGLALGTRPKMTARQFEMTPDPWVPYLAQFFPGTVLVIPYYIFGEAIYGYINHFISPTTVFDSMTILFVLVFTWLRQPHTPPKGGAENVFPGANLWLLAIAQVIIFAGVSIVPNWFALPHVISGGFIIVLTILALNYRAVFLRS